jgi:hypothetical protein
MQQQQVLIPMSTLATRNVHVGDTVNINQQVGWMHKTVTRIYKVMTVDRVNEIVSCICVSENEFRA